MRDNDNVSTEPISRDLLTISEINQLKVEITEVKTIANLSRRFGLVLLGVFVFFGFKTWADINQIIDSKINQKVEEKADKLTKELLPEQLARSVASFELNRQIGEYLNPSKEDKTDERIVYRCYLLGKINDCIDSDKYSTEAVRKSIVENQVTLSGFMPFLVFDLKQSKEFVGSSHIGFWIIYKFIDNSTGSIRKHNLEVFSGNSSDLNIDQLYLICVENVNKDTNANIKDNRKIILKQLKMAYSDIKAIIDNYKKQKTVN